jgi:hypothetical protein
MKWFLIVLIACGLLMAGPAAAQTAPDATPSVTVNKVQKQAIVEQTMALSPMQKEAFWPLYLEYEGAARKIDNRMKELIGTYLTRYDNLSDRAARAMMDEYIAIEQDRLKLKKKYMKKFGRVLPPPTTARFFQLENKMEAMKRAELATEIPLVR